MHHESLTPGSGTESSIPQNEVDEEEDVQEVQRSTRDRGGGRARGRGRGIGLTTFKYSHEQDKDLCRSLLTISNDGITRIDQTYGDLWEKIVQYYNDWRKEGPEVDTEKASNHWYKMSVRVSKFNGSYIQVKDDHPSGHDEDQMIKMAMKLWKNRNPTDINFPYLHSWKILRDEPKWQEFSHKEGRSSKRTENFVSGACTSSSSNVDTSETSNSVHMMDVRPPGKKVAKAAARGKGKTTNKKVNEDVIQTWGKFEDLQAKKLAMYEEHICITDFEILFKDTSNMDKVTSGTDPTTVRAKLRTALPRSPEKQLYDDAILHTSFARLLGPPRILDREADKTSDNIQLFHKLVAHLNNQISGFQAIVSELWYVEELDVLALALDGRMNARRFQLNCSKA